MWPPRRTGAMHQHSASQHVGERSDALAVLQALEALGGSADREMLQKLPELQAQGIHITDDAMVAEQMKKTSIRLVKASYRNIKITTPEDIAVAEAFLS